MKIKIFVLLAVFLFSAVGFAARQNQKRNKPHSGSKTEKQNKPKARQHSLATVGGLVKKLRAAGATVKSGEKIEQPFFSAAGQTINVNGETVQVFAYKNAETAEKEAKQISPEGMPATTMITWVAPPHFFKSGRLIALYVGENRDVIKALENVLGRQFAGK
jgi:hypothetical protein